MENQFYLALQKNKLFSEVIVDDLDLSELKGKLIPAHEGEILYREAEPSEAVYLVISGEINLIKKKLLGANKSVVYKENDFFGYDEMNENISRTSTAIVLQDSYLVALSRNEIEKLVEQNHIIKTNLMNNSDIIDLDKLEKHERIENETDEGKIHEFEDPDVSSFAESSKDDLIDQHDEELESESADYDGELKEEKYEEIKDPETPDEIVSYKSETIDEQDDEPFILDEEIEEEHESADLQEASSEFNHENELEHEQNDAYEELSRAFSEAENAEGKETIEDERIDYSNVEEPETDEENPEGSVTAAEDEAEFMIVPDEPPTVDDFVAEDENELKAEEDSAKAPVVREERGRKYNSKELGMLVEEQLKKIIKASQMVNSNIKLDDVLKNIVTVAADLTSADRGTLYLLDKERNELWSKVANGSEVKEIYLKLGEGLAGWAAENQEVVNVENAYDDPRFQPEIDNDSGYETKSVLCFPIQDREDKIVGVLQLLNSKKGRFTRLDEEFLNAISIQCALALQNADLVEKLLETERVTSLGKMTNFLIQDIKKPVLVSKRYAEHVKTKHLPQDAEKIIDMILDQLSQVADLVQTTSSYSEGKAVLRTSRLSVNETLEDYSDRLDSYVHTRNCEIINEFDTDVKANLDSRELFQVYNHLIRNACDAMPDGGNITVSTSIQGSKVQIVFKDEGIGIPENIVNRIFEPFMTSGKTDGTGLGLTIVKKIVEAHNGTIGVKSTAGEGSTFTIELPAAAQY